MRIRTGPASRDRARRVIGAGLAGAGLAAVTLGVIVAAAAPTARPQEAAAGGVGSQPTASPELTGGGASAADRVILITGSTDGLGREVALELAAPGTHIVVHGRNAERGQEAVRTIEERGGSARFFQADFADLAQVRRFGESVLREYDRLDVLVNNAGIWLTPEQGRRLSADGHEMHFAVNYLSHYLLTRMLLPLLREAESARIVNVASGAQQPIDFEDVMLEGNYSDGRGYAQSKLAQVIFTVDLAAELEGTGVAVYALHPATMMNTTMVLSRGASSRSSVEEGVAAVLHLVEAPGLQSGQYFNGSQPARANAQAYDPAARARLRQLSDRLTGSR